MGYSGSRARCVPLQYPSNATRGVKKALNKKPLNQNIIALSTPLQERKSKTDTTLNSLNKDSTGQVEQTGSGMFYELSNRNRMECEKYQDCSWFQQDPVKSGCNNKLSLAETFDPFCDADEYDLPMQYANAQTSPWGDEYLEVFTDDIHLEENYRFGEKNKNYILNENFYTNFKGDEDNAFDSSDINFSLKKTDSVDSMKNISSTNPAEVIPISYKERLSNSNYGLAKLDGIKSEIKQEAESCMSESNPYLIDSDDSDLHIGREEVVDEISSMADLQVVNKKEVESSHQIKCEVQTDKVPSECTTSNKSNNSINNGCNINQVSMPVKSEFSKINQSAVGKCDLNLDIAKLNFEPSLNINTPDLDFMDLVDYINAEMRQENVNSTSCNATPTNNVCEKSDTRQDVISAENQTNTENVQQSNEKSTSSSETVENVWSTDLKDNSTVDFNEVSSSGVSIAERIKTSAKRTTRRSIKDLIDTEDEESCDSLDDDEDYDYREDVAKRRCATIKRRTKSNLSESSGDGKRTSEESSSYRERRDKNNEASRRSRQNRKARERHMYETLEEEEKKNVKLKAEADILEKQVTSLRQLLLQVVLRKGGAT